MFYIVLLLTFYETYVNCSSAGYGERSASSQPQEEGSRLFGINNGSQTQIKVYFGLELRLGGQQYDHHGVSSGVANVSQVRPSCHFEDVVDHRRQVVHSCLGHSGSYSASSV